MVQEFKGSLLVSFRETWATIDPVLKQTDRQNIELGDSSCNPNTLETKTKESRVKASPNYMVNSRQGYLDYIISSRPIGMPTYQDLKKGGCGEERL